MYDLLNGRKKLEVREDGRKRVQVRRLGYELTSCCSKLAAGPPAPQLASCRSGMRICIWLSLKHTLPRLPALYLGCGPARGGRGQP